MDDGYRDVFDEHRDRLLHIARLLGGDTATAEDAVAEAFSRTYPHWKAGKVRDPGAYLRRAVVNEVARTGRLRRSPPRAVAPMRPSPDDDVAVGLWLAEALLALPERQRAVLVLRFFDDRSERDTAELLGIRPGTVKSATARGLAALRSRLSEANGHPTTEEDRDAHR